jgi:hypothetical protein
MSKLTLPALALAAAILAPTAAAGDYGVSIWKHSSKGSFGLSWSEGKKHHGFKKHGGYYAKHAVCAPKVWVPAHTGLVAKKVWVPGATEQVWVAPVYETRYDHCGKPYTVLVCAGYWKSVHKPGCYVTQHVPVHYPGHWKAGGC